MLPLPGCSVKVCLDAGNLHIWVLLTPATLTALLLVFLSFPSFPSTPRYAHSFSIPTSLNAFITNFVFPDEFNQSEFLHPEECLLVSYRLLVMAYLFCDANSPPNPEFSGIAMQLSTRLSRAPGEKLKCRKI